MSNLNKFMEVCEMQSGNQAKEGSGAKPVPEWVEMCKLLADIEDKTNELKRLIMREAGNVKGV